MGKEIVNQVKENERRRERDKEGERERGRERQRKLVEKRGKIYEVYVRWNRFKQRFCGGLWFSSQGLIC